MARNAWELPTIRIKERPECLERAYAARSGGMVWMKAFPYFKNLYSHPRFQDIAQRVGLPG